MILHRFSLKIFQIFATQGTIDNLTQYQLQLMQNKFRNLGNLGSDRACWMVGVGWHWDGGSVAGE